MQQSLSPSPQGLQPRRDSISQAYTVCESPVSLVSPCKDLIAQTGAMLIDSHSMKFASPCYGAQTDATEHTQDLAPQRPPSRQHSSAPEGTAACTQDARASARSQQAHACALQVTQPIAVSSSVAQGWGAEAVTSMPLSQPAAIEEIARAQPASLPLYHSLPGMQHAPLAMHALPVNTGSHFYPAGPTWGQPQAAARLPASGAGVYSTSFCPGSGQSTFLPALMMQRQQAQGLPSQSFQPAAPNSGTAMRQLALSTAATADLLAGMAATTSQAHPDSASDLILAASATLQAFARAATSAQGSGPCPQGVSSTMMLSNPAVPPRQVLEQSCPQLSAVQQAWQPQQHTWSGAAQLF